MAKDIMIALLQAKQCISSLDFALENGSFYPFQEIIIEADKRAMTKGYLELFKKFNINNSNPENEEVPLSKEITLIFSKLEGIYEYNLILAESQTNEVVKSELLYEAESLKKSLDAMKNSFN